MKELIMSKLISRYDNHSKTEFNGYYTSDSLKQVQDLAKKNNISIILDHHGDGSIFGFFSYLITEEDITCIFFDGDLVGSIQDRDNVYKDYYQNIDKIKSIKDKRDNLKLPLTTEESNILYYKDRYEVLDNYYVYTSKVYEELIKGNKIYIVKGV